MMLFGLMDLFSRLFGRQNAAMRHVSDSSYWLYLVYLPLIIIAQQITRQWRLPAMVKFALICTVVIAVLLVAYQGFVRYSWLGTLLNGPRQRATKVIMEATD